MEKTIGIIIQARIGSTRLPEKVIRKIEGKTVLEHVIERAKRIKDVGKIILATTAKKEDDILEKIAMDCGMFVFRGSENDVLDRFYQTAKKFGIDHIIRITADCPVIDSNIVDKVVNYYFEGGFDYVGNSHPPTFPDGMDIEIFNFGTLKRAWKNAVSNEDREHVTSYIYKNPNEFKTGNFSSDKNYSDIRLTLDEKEDLELIKKIYGNLYKSNPQFGLEDIVNVFSAKPKLIEINSKIKSHPISRWRENQQYYES